MFPLIAGKIYSKSIRQVNKKSKDSYKCNFNLASPTYKWPLPTPLTEFFAFYKNVFLEGKY